jgi:CubicO group peptidase (beta-lactamase class C family)
VPTPHLGGHAEAGYGLLADVFADNFATRGEVGAALTLFVEGRKVVDLWGGPADRRSARPWVEDTSVVVFSCTKAIVAICVYRLVDQGLLDLDAPVARYWPEYARNGKQDTTVRWLLAHRAGLPSLDRDLTLEEVLAWRPVIEAIEEQTPHWTPGTAHSYHAMTYGWLAGEVIRRITGQTPGQYFHHSLAQPLGLHTWIGLPAARLETVAWTEPPPYDPILDDPAISRPLTMGGAFGFPAEAGVVTFNDPRIQTAEIPAAGGVSTARGLARLFAGCVSAIDGPRLLTRDAVDDALTVRSSGPQRSGLADTGQRWGTGFLLHSPPARPLLGERSFGHDGAGGHLAFGDDEHEVGFAYVTNQMGPADDDRANRLTAAVRACLGARTPSRRRDRTGGMRCDDPA